MSKLVKQLEMDALRQTFEGIDNFVVLEPFKVNADLDYNTRKTLREKNINLQVVKNSLARIALKELGIELDKKIWEGTTMFAWGAESLKDLSKAIDSILKEANKDAKKTGERFKVKIAFTEGQPVGFDQALKMPTRKEAIGEVVSAILGPAMEIAAQLIGPSSQLASQIAQIAEKEEEQPEG